MMITTRSSWLAAWWFLWLHHPLWLQRRQETFSFPSNPGSGQRHQQQGGDGRGKAVAGLHHKAGHEIDLVLMFLFLQGKTSSMSLESPGCTSCRFWFDLSSFVQFLQECLFPFGVAYALQKDSPYTQRYSYMKRRICTYVYIFTYMYCFLIFFSQLCYDICYNMKVQQQDSAAEGIRTNQPLDSPGARPRWSESWRRFECDFFSMWLMHKDPVSERFKPWWDISSLPQ